LFGFTITNMDKPKATWGGPGRGGGRKARDASAPVVQSYGVKLTEAQKLKVKRLGGADWVRRKIDEAEEPPKE
jgi:hypothetical protein